MLMIEAQQPSTRLKPIQVHCHVLTACLLCAQAMGNFPYPSTYILNGAGEMPAFPVRAACEYIKEEDLSTDQLLSAFADSLGIFYNYSKA